jgi:uncharacterized membrane protein YecN with MAPEG domain
METSSINDAEINDNIVPIDSKEYVSRIIKLVMGFLQLFMCKTLAIRLVCLILLAGRLSTSDCHTSDCPPLY